MQPLSHARWGDEAARIANSQETSLGRPNNEDDSLPWRDPATNYVLTGCSEWRSATKAERRMVIEVETSGEWKVFVCPICLAPLAPLASLSLRE